MSIFSLFKQVKISVTKRISIYRTEMQKKRNEIIYY